MRIFGLDIKKAKSADVQEDTLSADKIVQTPEGPLPVASGRTSQPESYDSLLELVKETLVQPDIPMELLGALENLAKFNPDVSYALDNIVQLGNTPYDIYFNDDLPDGQAEEMLDEIRSAERLWYSNSGGMLSLRNDLLAQLALTGAVSSERIPTNNLDGIGKVVLVNPKTVRFAYNPETGEYEPYQQSTSIIGKSATNLESLNKLNPVTYKYLALRKFNESPYGIPPFLAALESAGTEKYMLDNFRTIVKKLGVLGFLNVLVNQPNKKPNQTEAEYAKDVQDYLNSVAKEVEKGVNKGFVVGIKNNHAFNMEAVNSNVTGAKDLFRLNSELKMAGLKQDPLMLGRNYSTTETVGRVILAKLGAQIQNYQAIVDMFLADTIHLHLLLKGFNNVKYVKLESKKPLIGDETREQEAYAKKLDNAVKLYNEGIINQDQKAQMVGYDKADQEEPRVSTSAAATPPIDNTPVPDPADPKTTQYAKANFSTILNSIQRRISEESPEYDYCGHGTTCGCTSETKVTLEQFSREKDFNKIIQKYARAIGVTYDEAVRKISYKVALELQKLGKGASVSSIVDNVMYHTFLGFESNFKNEIKDTVAKFIEDAYVFYRQDASVFRNLVENIPDSTFTLSDFRAIDYYKNSDNLYLGRFITDESTKKKIVEFIKKTHLENGMPIGKDPDGIALFREQFEDVLKGEDWKISRIINTTTNKMRNTAALNYMDQAEVVGFKVIGISDTLQCKYCSALNGRTFDVKVALAQQNEILQGDPAYVSAATPFITSSKLGIKPEDIQAMAADELQAKGLGMPPFHGNCRCQVVVDL